nr:peptidylprolyl isomerase [Candidatus Neomarinimicrobiota bacterium]
MMRRTITVLAIIFFMVSCETKNKESIMDKYDGAVISTKFGDIVLEFFDDIAPKHVESFKLH